jgi:hypothetical protein
MIQIVIVKSKNLNRGQKKIHSILLWSVPFVWGGLVIISVISFTKDSKRTGKEINHYSEYKDNMKNLTIWGDDKEI